MTRTSTPGDTRTSWPRYGLDVLRGALIGTAETVPGVSGGTVALVVRVYDTAIGSAGHLLSGALRAGTDLPRGRGGARAREEFRAVQWRVIVPLLAGMIAAVLLMAGLMEGLVDDYPVQTKALFFGLVLASLWVPYSLAIQSPTARNAQQSAPTRQRWGWRDGLLALVAAVVAYFLVSLPPGDLQATPLIIVLAAVIAVSGLVLPGLSGSFLLLTFGLYEQTLSAVDERDLAYLGLFALGAVIGLASIVKLLQWLLTSWRRRTLVVLTGLMAGALRALWPWQNDDRALLAPDAHLGSAVALMLLGFAVVATVLVIERRVTNRRESS